MEVRKHLQRAYRAGEKIPRGVRTIAGLALTALGIVGFLPILGFWMLPLGLMLIGLDIPVTRRWIRRRLEVES